MKITCLMDDHNVPGNLNSEHGLSLYIKMKNHHILFDTGQSAQFISNAIKLGIDLNQVNIVVISHGHYDHGGGLKAFLKMNQHAKVYIQADAFQDFYSLRENNNYAYIGLDKSLKNHPQVKLIKGDYLIDPNLQIIHKIKEQEMYPKGNQSLYVKKKDTYVHDDFSHEQSLLIHAGHQEVLIAGCAHRGILNIIQATNVFTKAMLDLVVGGFHLKTRHAEYAFSKSEIEFLAKQLKDKSPYYLTGHCTGDAYQTIKRLLKNQVDIFYPGKYIEMPD